MVEFYMLKKESKEILEKVINTHKEILEKYMNSSVHQGKREKLYPCQKCGKMRKTEDLRLVGEFRQFCKGGCEEAKK